MGKGQSLQQMVLFNKLDTHMQMKLGPYTTQKH